MALPLTTNIELPILYELNALGGKDEVKFLYNRLISYFPSLSDADVSQIKIGTEKRWRLLVQKAGKNLDEQKKISRHRGIWTITEKGRLIVAQESEGIVAVQNFEASPTHTDIQSLICGIGKMLGYETQMEFEYYDVVWREKSKPSRLSHVFEVQSKGNLDSAFAKLKRAYDAQRSKPFLILDSERDTNRAYKSLDFEFSELNQQIVILSFAEIKRVFENMRTIESILPHFLKS